MSVSKRNVPQGTQPNTALRASAFFILSALSASMPVMADVELEVLHQFSLDSASGTEGEALGKNPRLPPVFNPVDGKLYGVTPEGGVVQGGFSVNYRFTPGAETSDYESASNAIGVMAGFFPSLAVTSGGTVLGAANPVYDATVAMMLPFFGYTGPVAESGLLFKWNDDGDVEQLLSDVDTDSLYGSHFSLRGLIAIDAQDNLYFGGGSSSSTSGMALFRYTSAGALEFLADFSREEYIINGGDAYVKGHHPGAVIFSDTDQAVYGLATQASSSISAGDPAQVEAGDPAGTLFRINATDFTTDGSSTIEILHTFSESVEGEINTNVSEQPALIEDGEWLYGTTSIALWRVKKSDPESFTVLHQFGVDAGDGDDVFGPLVKAIDGNIYGTTKAGVATEDADPAAAGTLYRVVIGSADDRSDDVYEQVHAFDEATQGSQPVGLSLGATVDGAQTLYGATKTGGSDADLGTVYAFEVYQPGTLTVSVDSAEITLGDAVTVSWSGENLASCSIAEAWSTSTETSGSESVTPSAMGTSSYSVTCTDLNGDTVSDTAEVNVLAVPGTLSLSADATSIKRGDSVTLTWSGENLAACTASDAWSGDKETSGTETLTPDAVDEYNYTLTCTDLNGDEVSQSVSLDVTKRSGGSMAYLLVMLLGVSVLRVGRARK